MPGMTPLGLRRRGSRPLPLAGGTMAGAIAMASHKIAQCALTANQTFLGQSPTFPLTTGEQQALVAQVAALTRQVNTLIYLRLQQLASTAGT